MRSSARPASPSTGASTRTSPPLGDDAEIVVYRVAQEALTNVVRHAGAERVVIALGRDDEAVTLTVDDDGRGVPATSAPRRAASPACASARCSSAAGSRSASAPLGGTRVTPGVPAAMTTPAKATVLVADDHAVVRHGVRGILDAQPDFEVVAEAGDGVEAVEKALALRPALVILDVSMPRMSGLEAAAVLARRAPEIRLLMLSMHDDEQYLFEALRAGASGYVLEVRRRPRPRRGLPRDDARRGVPLPRRGRGADQGAPGPRGGREASPRRTRSRRARPRCSS